jgi:hypothetical protein
MSFVIDVARFVALSSAAALIAQALNRFTTCLDGLSKRLRALNQKINPPDFTFNPTNCDPMSVGGTATSDEGASAGTSVPFQVANCAGLKFKLGFSASTQGKTSKADGPSLHVKLVPPHEGRSLFARFFFGLTKRYNQESAKEKQRTRTPARQVPCLQF